MSKISLSEVFLSDTKSAGKVYRLKKQGLIRNITGKLYTSNLKDTIENITDRRLWEIVGLLFPGAVIADRTAIEMKPTKNGEIFVIASKTRPISFGKFTVCPRRGVPALENDIPFMGNMFLMSEPRKYLENMRNRRGRKNAALRYLSPGEMEEKLEAHIRHYGENAVNTLRDQMREIAKVLSLEAEYEELDRIVGGLLRTREAEFTTSAAMARSAGHAFDPNRVFLFTELYNELAVRAPVFRKTQNNANKILCFYEAYFSNYIEGTTFTVEEAASIVFDHKIPEKRPNDAHDIAGTYNIVSSMEEMRKTPGNFDEFLELLKARHIQMMIGRPDTMPGRFKKKANQAGSTLFVSPELVQGTLKEGFRLYQKLDTAFAKAVFMMFLVAEVHPFDDGNGRISRIMMNAEFVSMNEQRIIIPTVYRDNYLDALRGLSHNHILDACLKMLDFAQRYTASIDWSSLRGAADMLQATNAFSEDKNSMLRLPCPY
ncbi:MAG: Fic family protein [Synergistaceae bacterium]|jgi:Fic family protein|nr:Fic family protein [Synergistaceae bacterium]